MGAQPPVPIPAGIAVGSGGVGPTTAIEVKSLGIGTAAGTPGSLRIKAQTSTATYDSPTTAIKTGGWLWFSITNSLTKRAHGMALRPSKGTSNGEVDIGFGLRVYPATGGAYISAIFDTGLIWAGNGYGTRTPTVKTLALVSGVAQEPTATRDMTVTLQLAAAVAGHATISIGPGATGTTHVVATAMALAAGTGQLVTVHVPMAWKIKVTLTTVTITKAVAIG